MRRRHPLRRVTRDLRRRLDQLNACARAERATRGAAAPVRLLEHRTCPDQGTALRLERAVKARPRAQKRIFLQKGTAAVLTPETALAFFAAALLLAVAPGAGQTSLCSPSPPCTARARA